MHERCQFDNVPGCAATLQKKDLEKSAHLRNKCRGGGKALTVRYR